MRRRQRGASTPSRTPAQPCSREAGAVGELFTRPRPSEQGSLSPALRRRVHPDRCLRLSAALEYAPAVAELARRGERTGQRDEAAEGERRRKRFTRQELSKARSWTGRDERAEAYLEQLLGGGGL